MIDLKGRKFGKLTVVEFVGLNKNKTATRKCKCDCGETVIKASSHLLEGDRIGNNQSCGCARRKAHLMVKTKFYHKYSTMRSRCEKEYFDSYKSYGAKGIKCERRKFSDFYDDMYESYVEHCKEFGEGNTTIERIDNNKNYCKENCRRATIKEQANNKKSNRIYTYKGETKTLALRAEKLGLTYRTLYHRLLKGIPFEFIVEHPEVTHVSMYKKINDCDEQLKKYQ